ENRSHELVCSGARPVRDAQHAIATDWIAAYHTYVAGDADPPDLSSATPSEDELANATASANDSQASTTAAPAETPTLVSSPKGGQAAPLADGSCPDDAPIKGNASSHIYHVPGGASYAATQAEACFATPAAAEAAGHRAELL